MNWYNKMKEKYDILLGLQALIFLGVIAILVLVVKLQSVCN